MQRKLALDGREKRISRARERDEERVSLRIDLVAAVGGESGSKQALVIGQHVAIAIAELLDEPRRPLDVGEEKRDRAGRHLGHARKPEPRSARSGKHARRPPLAAECDRRDPAGREIDAPYRRHRLDLGDEQRSVRSERDGAR